MEGIGAKHSPITKNTVPGLAAAHIQVLRGVALGFYEGAFHWGWRRFALAR